MLGFAYQLLRQVLFGECTIEEVANAWGERVENRKEVWEARRAGIARRLTEEDQRYRDGGAASCGYR